MEITDVDLVEKLDTTIHVTRKQGEERASFQVEGLKQWAKNPRSGDKRLEERIEKVTTDSSVCEVAIAAALGGQVNTQEFDYKIPQTYAYDVSLGGYQEDAYFEVKWMSMESEWYSFNEKLIRQVEDRKQYYDRLIVATNLPAKCGGWNVFPRLIIDPQSFTRWLKPSKYDNYKPYYYNHYNPSCVILNEKKISQMKGLLV